ncbi:hypothetical protein RJD11_02275 [Bacillus velezensis]|uniref:hypothetical protein n=1 Tax=Bacillus TaxID=1386 RepID=UPI001C530602|nr:MULTISPECIES: hypothetical protein [Bacillus amyloliquefaciens group]QXP97588.1 hypothetical protein KVY05_02255 [Bacillus velezensis]UHH03426.1 hypothetical protein LUA14_02275 [Bacillus amyloliquefaciens]ULR23162.1 hypothetical protein MJE83_02275 [Bacillus velezensis]UVW09950.1 hypothetical protein NX856_02280 [Bacillus velezensis]WHL77275.1 hypothetical protein QLH34_02275 [Bacillus velezensis]
MQAVKQFSFIPEVSGCFLSVKLNSSFRVSAVREGFFHWCTYLSHDKIAITERRGASDKEKKDSEEFR